MHNNPYGSRKGKAPLEGLEARFNALPAWGRFGLIGLSALVTIVAGIVTVVMFILAVSPPQQSVSAQVAVVATTAATVPTPTPTPILTPASTPMPTQQLAPAQPSTQQPASTPLFVTITNAFATDYGPGSVSVHTLPDAALTISVKYCSGSYADSKSLKGNTIQIRRGRTM